MNALLNQLGLDQTFFIELGLLAIILVTLSHVYFKPFLKLFKARNLRTIADREAAEKMIQDAQEKFETYQKAIAEEKESLKKAYDQALVEITKKESEILSFARNEAKKITQQTVETLNQQSEQTKIQLESQIHSIAQSLSERLLSRKI